MKAPDKIYISFLKGLPCRFDLEPNSTYNQIEYIRKDAIAEYLNKCKANPVFIDLQIGNIEELIDKINSL